MMRTIRAEEALQDVAVHAVAAGTMKKGAGSKVRRHWERDASRYPISATKKSDPVVRRGQDPTVALAAFGIVFKKIKRG